jgi:hypothetical protein
MKLTIYEYFKALSYDPKTPNFFYLLGITNQHSQLKFQMDIPRQKLVYCFALLGVLQVLQYKYRPDTRTYCQLLVSAQISCLQSYSNACSHHDTSALCSSPATLSPLQEVPWVGPVHITLKL